MEFLKSILHPSEVVALLKFKYSLPKLAPEETKTANQRWCFEKLSQTSRSFAIVIQKLNEELRVAIAIFYLVLRALDTVEDDMSFPNDLKADMLRKFHEFLLQPNWTFEGCGEGSEKELLQNFDKVIDVYSNLPNKYQEVIKDITCRMGNGMADYAEKNHVDSIDEYNQYCYYVAGLVGIGLSQLFHRSGLEAEWFEKESEAHAISMGDFLQKVNIIRDYYEDILETRIWWPKEVWSMYTKKLENFKDPEHVESAVHCLNHLITNALEHAPQVLQYLSRVREPSVFAFCAIPQVMAIATLSVCYQNPKVFSSVVKIRRGETAQIFLQATDIQNVNRLFYQFASSIEQKIPNDDPVASITREVIQVIKNQTGVQQEPSGYNTITKYAFGTAVVVSSLAAVYVIGKKR